MSESTELTVPLNQKMIDIGVMSDNKWDIQRAIEYCHDALVPLDSQQLVVVEEHFPAIIVLANQYAQHTPGKRSFD